MKQTFILAHPVARRRAMSAVADAPDGHVITVAEPNRSSDQNAALWPLLQAFSDQLQWPVNGKLCKLTPEEFKDILSAAFKAERVRLAMGLDGGVVMLGLRTSQMGKREFSDFLDFINSVAADRGVETHVAA